MTRRVLVVGLHSRVTKELAQQLANDVKARTGLDTVVIDGCSAIVELELDDDS